MREIKPKRITKGLLAVRVPNSTLDDAKAIAEKKGMVLSDYVRFALEWYNRDQQKGKKASGC